jgi:hypothetical protein
MKNWEDRWFAVPLAYIGALGLLVGFFLYCGYCFVKIGPKETMRILREGY